MGYAAGLLAEGGGVLGEGQVQDAVGFLGQALGLDGRVMGGRGQAVGLVLPLEQLAPFIATPLDALRDDSSIFLEQRGAGGAQSDLTLRGGSWP